jgi:hypothetical protein
METENTPPTPTSLVLISIFWILIGTFIVTITSRYLSAPSDSYLVLLGIIPFMIGIGLIMVGWGLLTLRKWAYYTSLIFSLIGTGILLIFNTVYLGSVILYDWDYLNIETIYRAFIPMSFFLGFIFMVGYLIKNKDYFEKKQ